jgi:hypothetical protein
MKAIIYAYGDCIPTNSKSYKVWIVGEVETTLTGDTGYTFITMDSVKVSLTYTTGWEAHIIPLA